MPTTFWLIRHAIADHVGRALAGRAPGVRLNEEGREQAGRLAEWLAAGGLGRRTVAAIYSSPLERARETAEALAGRLGAPVETRDALTEIDVGEWTGRTFAELEPDWLWKRFNVFRSGTRAPGGETMHEVQRRMVAELEALRERHSDGTVAIVSHADPIKAAIMYFLGMPLDLFLRLEIAPATVSVLALDDWGARLTRLNATGTARME